MTYLDFPYLYNSSQFSTLRASGLSTQDEFSIMPSTRT
nr:MAG TPA: hypothetical protein [Caudoviricetes sp.]